MVGFHVSFLNPCQADLWCRNPWGLHQVHEDVQLPHHRIGPHRAGRVHCLVQAVPHLVQQHSECDLREHGLGSSRVEEPSAGCTGEDAHHALLFGVCPEVTDGLADTALKQLRGIFLFDVPAGAEGAVCEQDLDRCRAVPRCVGLLSHQTRVLVLPLPNLRGLADSLLEHAVKPVRLITDCTLAPHRSGSLLLLHPLHHLLSFELLPPPIQTRFPLGKCTACAFFHSHIVTEPSVYLITQALEA
mmetsp:Transcript_54282/g.168383  ORF Transcript_54282/g.168383 Transcript_54282/m.168383 type:complete len:244 (+) Transcript_54282:1457-2188(+)